MLVSSPERMLGSSSTTAERVQALASILDAALVARVAGVTSAAVRNWMDGAEPRTDAAMTIDDLRSVVAILLDGGFEPNRVRSWLLSRNDEWLQGARPLDEISRVPAVVLGAASDAVVVHRHGAEAAASREGGPVPPLRHALSRRHSKVSE
jgi:hypothetical protein